MSQIKKQNGKLYIRDSTGTWRTIGTIDEELKTLQVFRDKSKHLHRNTNSYGINKEIIDIDWFTYVVFTEKTDKGTNIFAIPTEDLKVKPAYKAKDFEIQVMISLDELKDYKF